MLTNRQKTVFFNILANPFFMAIPIAFLIAVFLPNPSSKYKIELISKNIADKEKSKITYCDLNNDGKDERVIGFHNNAKGEASIKIVDNEGLVYDAWNFHGYFQIASDNFFCSDLDNDGYGEIVVFYNRYDSVFLSVLQAYPEKKLIIEDRFISTIEKRNGEIDFSVSDFRTIDLHNDGKNELIFLLKAGYSRQPRIIVSFDIFKDSVTKSKSIGARLSNLHIIDIDGDTIPELYFGSSTSANIHDSLEIPYNDYSSYFFGYNNDLELLFPPIVNHYYPSSVAVCKFHDQNGKPVIAVLYNNAAEKEQVVRFYDYNYNLIFEKNLSQSKTSKWNSISYMVNVTINNKDLILVGVSDNNFIFIDEKGKEIRRKVFEDGTLFRNYEDLNKDGYKEFVFVNAEHDLFIYDHNLDNPVKYMLNEPPFSTKWLGIGVKHNGKNESNIYLRTDSYLYLFDYDIDNFYYLKYPLWLLVYFLVVLILWGAQRLQTIQEKRKQEIEDTINSLQIKTIKSQMDPHFMFNVLNGLANNVAKGSSDEAYNQILHFSKLLRAMMNRTEKIDISLKEELDFIKNYLELEKFRFKDDFEYSIEMGETVDLNIHLPRMLIQLLVENSIKHGLINKVGVKKVSVLCNNNHGKTTIIVEDNGIGRKKTKETLKKTGNGLKIIRDMIRLNKKLTGKDILLEYTDLYDENGEASGTKVEVEVEV